LYDVIILGAGASGLFLSTLLKNKKVLLIDHNPAAKIKVSGGGKCNITNEFVSEDNYLGDKEFIRKTLKKFDNKDLLKWLEDNNLKVYKRKNNQYFLSSSENLIDFFFSKKPDILKATILDVEGNRVFTTKGEFRGKKIVVALGGKSYKKLGATNKGLEIAKKLEVKFKDFKPALVGLTVQPRENWFKNLSGVSVFAKVQIEDKIFEDNVLFSHKGITGPAILNASLYWERGKISIKFLDTFNLDKNRQIVQLPLPKRMIKEFLKAFNIKDKKVKFLNSKEKEVLKLLLNYEFAPAGTFGFERAEVSKGGVLSSELDEFMKSKKGLYFIGEVVDVTGELGGYNFQWAFSSAYAAYLDIV
jgi:predicted Rossmann fold flavoprotein